jgi:uncharacterized protein involved in exopolysaccharide biosynthesis
MDKEIKKPMFTFDSFAFIKFAWEKKWILISVSIAAFIISAIISLVIPPKYKSTVIMYPAASISMSKSLVETGSPTSDAKDARTFGEDVEAERLLQILNSEQLINHLIEKFNLKKHYKVDSTSKFYMTTIKNTIASNIKSQRTKYKSIKTDVFDEDPQMAADMANEITSYVDTIYYEIGLKRAQEAYDIVMNEYCISKTTIKNITDSINMIHSYGITDYGAQASAFNRAYAKAILKRDTGAMKTFENKLAVLEKYGAIFSELSSRLGWQISRLSSLEAKLASSSANLKPTISNVFIVDKATKAEKKISPKRSIIVFMSTLSTFAFILLLLMIVENFKTRI